MSRSNGGATVHRSPVLMVLRGELSLKGITDWGAVGGFGRGFGAMRSVAA